MTEETLETVAELLDKTANKLTSGIVMGFDKEGKFVLTASDPSIPYMHWLLNRAVFEVNLFEVNHKEDPPAKD
jgi:hypothetical protein